MSEQIKILMDAKNLSATQFSEEIGIQRSSLSHVLSGRNKPSLDFMLKIKSRFPDTNLDWLLMGIGKMVDEKVSEKEIEKEVLETENIEKKPDFSLFSEKINKPDQLKEEDEVILKSDDAPKYQQKTAKSDKSPEQVIILYADQTFSIYTPKG